VNEEWRYVPLRKWDEKCLYKSIGFLHIPRTGGTYLSRKMYLGVWDVNTWKHGLVDHRLPTARSLAERGHWFTLVRNPYDRMASELKRAKKSIEYLEQMSEPPKEGHFCTQASFAKLADTLIRYENMPEGVNALMEKLNLPVVDFSDWAPKAHTLTDIEKKVIGEKYREDFDFLNYPL
jgi:hypothetical protein